MYKILHRWGKLNKGKHGHNCRNLIFLNPFSLSVDGTKGKEAQVLLTTLSQLMVTKMDEPIYHAKGWVNDRIAIPVARLYYRVLH